MSKKHKSKSGPRKPHVNPPIEFRFKPGQSGNPKGRPKKRPISERYAIFAEMALPENIRKRLKLAAGATWGDAGVLGIFQAMIKGNPAALKEVREAIEGKSPQRFELTAEGGGPVKLTLVDTVEKIKAIYGLSRDPDPAVASQPVPVSAPVDRGQEPQKDSGQK